VIVYVTVPPAEPIHERDSHTEEIEETEISVVYARNDHSNAMQSSYDGR